jgi:ribosomal protein S1
MTDNNFDWSIYENGYTGGTKLVVNKNIKTDRRTKIFSHAPYAQELYEKYTGSVENITAKDNIKGTVYNVQAIYPVSPTEIRIDTDNGMSSIVDMNKEKQFVESIGFKNVFSFMDYLNKHKKVIPDGITAKVTDNRVSIWGGLKDKIEREFMAELESENKHSFPARVVSLGAGGFIVNIMGVECFMPKSLAASGPISDPESYLGKTLNVCIVNYSQPTSNFVVSYKKYLEMILPSKIKSEFYVGAAVTVMVTGASKNGLFCAIKDKDGEFIVSSLLHRSVMSHDMEVSFDNHEYVKGDMFIAYISKITQDEEGNYRIVISDKKPTVTESADEVDNTKELAE